MVIDGGEEDENGVGVRRAAGRIGENLFVFVVKKIKTQDQKKEISRMGLAQQKMPKDQF